MLLNIGFIMLTRLSFPLAVKQFIIVCMGTLIVSVIPWIMKKFRELRRFAWLYGIIGIGLLLIVLLTADTTNGAKLFLDLKYFTIQPSEFVKLIYVFFIAAMFEKSSNFKQVIITSLMAAIHVLLLVASKDLGGALIFAVIYLMMLYAATRQPLYLFGGLLCGSAASYVAWKLFDHIQVRVTAWLNPWEVIDTKGYQIAQSLFAIGTGGYLGSGLYEGSPGQIPIVEQDFIFSAIAEELGGIVALCVILICLGCLLLFLNTAIKSNKPFYHYLAYGLTIAYGIQVFLTIGGALKLIPSTGVTLPLVSYGGSSMLSTLCMFSVVQGIYISNCEKPVKAEGNRKNGKEAADSRELYRVMYLFSGMFCLLCGYLCYFLTFESKAVINNPYNLRQDNFGKKIVRGEILSAEGDVLAQTLVTEDGEESRFYPYGEMFSHVVGYSENGKSGIEQEYNFELLTSDIPIYEKLYHEFAGTKSQGNQVLTTLSAKLQKAAYEAMGEHRGAVVVIEPSTGKILAMVSKPDFNPNTITE
ncbi:MAG: FtsW/RodA/SpoVE family cell cycle protein, partial [Lachnospiraceae bacterium]|nr:FtsW/RodA/SpoVE family cell cycle protein [Lachnospiraceae bacterium]